MKIERLLSHSINNTSFIQTATYLAQSVTI